MKLKVSKQTHESEKQKRTKSWSKKTAKDSERAFRRAQKGKHDRFCQIWLAYNGLSADDLFIDKWRCLQS